MTHDIESVLGRLEELEKSIGPAPWRWERYSYIDFGYVDADGKPTIMAGESCEGSVDHEDPEGIALAEMRNKYAALLAYVRALRTSTALGYELSRYAASSRTDNTPEFVEGLMELCRKAQDAQRNTDASERALAGGGE
jgi:hypothetical protein